MAVCQWIYPNNPLDYTKCYTYLKLTINMNTERFSTQESITEIGKLVFDFKNLNEENLESLAFQDLENTLESSGFTKGGSENTLAILHNNSLYCRSDSFTNILEVTVNEESISLTNPDKMANICKMNSSRGFKTAMTEGFAGEDVNHHVKSVVTFRGDGLEEKSPVPKDDKLWTTKPNTAESSLIGSGQITKDDVEMVSFRFPVSFYPAEMLTGDEEDKIEDSEIDFIVRHYIKKPTY